MSGARDATDEVRAWQGPDAAPGPDTLRLMVERVADGLVVVDADGAIVFANPAAAALFGRPADELLGRPFGAPLVERETSEIEVVRRGGHLVTAELRAAETRWRDAPAWVVSLRDVTERRRAEAQAAELAAAELRQRAAEAANRTKSEFLATMSHELRTPLNAILGYGDLLEMGIDGELTAKQRRHVDRMVASARHLLGLVNEVLDLARVEEGRLSVERDEARIADALDAAAELVRPQASSAGLTLDVACPIGRAPTYVGDAHRVRQILVNLLANAVKFTEPGGRVLAECGATARPDAEAQLEAGGPWVYVRVTDTGVGIDPDQLDAVFAPFVQAKGGHTRPHDGSGLGLTISRRLARLMGGDLTARSSPGEGSAFTLWLPTGASAESETHDGAEDDGAEDDGAEDEAAADTGAPAAAAAPAELPALDERSARELAAALRRGLDPATRSFARRLRDEAIAPAAARLPDAQLADHAVTLLADVSVVIGAFGAAGGEPSVLLVDGTAIQRLTAERHGLQRASVGWTTDAIRREYAMLREEAAEALRTCGADVGGDALRAGIDLAERLLARAEALSLRAFERARREAGEHDVRGADEAGPAR